MEKIFYLAQVFGVLNTIGHIVLVISVVALFIEGCLVIAAEDDDERKKTQTIKDCKRACKKSSIFLALGFLLTCFVPSKETYLFMVGGKVVDSAIEQNPSVKDLPGNTLQLLNEYIVSKTEGICNKE